MFNKSLIAAFAATAVSLLGPIAKADNLYSASAVGAVYIGSTQMLSIDVKVTDYVFTNPAFASQVSGNVYITGYSGNFGVSIGAPVASVTFKNTLIGGVNYPTAHLTTGEFLYADLETGQQTLAMAAVDIVKYGGRGMICFEVTNLVNGATLAMTCDNTGALTDLPLTTGSSTMKAPPIPPPAAPTASTSTGATSKAPSAGVAKKTP